MSAISPSEASQLLRALDDLYVSNLLAGVAVTLVVYDWILVFGIEHQTIHQSRWTLPKALFYYIRLITPPGIVLGAFLVPLTASFIRYSPSCRSNSPPPPALVEYGRSCRIWAPLAIFGMLSSLIAANALLTLRLVALYKRNRILVWFIIVFFVASYAATLGLCIDAILTYNGTIHYSDLFKVCSTEATSKTMSAIFYAPAAFEAFVFFLTAYRALHDARNFMGGSSTPFLAVLYRDGAVSFVIMIGIRIWNVWIYTTAPVSSYNMGTMMMWALNTILTTRVYMNLVWLVKKPIAETSNKDYGFTGASAGIPMRIHTVTEVHTDSWHPRFDAHRQGIQELDNPQSPYQAKS